MVAGGGFYSYYTHQGNKSAKERKIVSKKLIFIHTKRFYTFFKRWAQFRVGAIPRLPFFTYFGTWLLPYSPSSDIHLKPKKNLISFNQLYAYKVSKANIRAKYLNLYID